MPSECLFIGLVFLGWGGVNLRASRAGVYQPWHLVDLRGIFNRTSSIADPGGELSRKKVVLGPLIPIFTSHFWLPLVSLFTFMHWRRKWQPTPVFLPGESQGQRSLVGCRLWGRRVGHDWSGLAAAAATVTVQARALMASCQGHRLKVHIALLRGSIALLMGLCVLSHFNQVQLCATPWTVPHQALLSMGFSRQENWTGLSYPPPGGFPNPGIETYILLCLWRLISCIGRQVLYH